MQQESRSDAGQRKQYIEQGIRVRVENRRVAERKGWSTMVSWSEVVSTVDWPEAIKIER
jgi:hypothetical protein